MSRRYSIKLRRKMRENFTKNGGHSTKEVNWDESQVKVWLDVRRKWQEEMRPLANFTATASFPGLSTLPQNSMNSAKLFPNREIMLSELILDGFRIIEVGSQEGKFAEFLARVKPNVSLIAIDIYTGLIKERGVLTGMNNVQVLEGDSSSILNALSPKFDLIYIDGDHAYDGVKKDATSADFLLEINGLMVFNDYTPWSYLEQIPYGIPQVVHELVESECYEIVGFAFHPWGYHDIALRKINNRE